MVWICEKGRRGEVRLGDDSQRESLGKSGVSV